MADVESPVQVGFAEFIARLMSEVFDSVITSQVDQEQRYAQMLASAAMSPEEYGSRYLGDEDVAVETASFFPPRPEDKDMLTSVYQGSPYRLDKETRDESPPFAEVLGLQLGKDGVGAEGDRLFLTQAGVDAVHAQIRSRLSVRHLDIAGQIISRGLPRVVVDSGRINGKLTFHLTETSSAPADSAAEPVSGEALPTVASGRTIKGKPGCCRC